MDGDDQVYPEVVISGRLALDMLEVLEWATLRTREGETVAREAFAQMSHALEFEVRDAAPPMRWVLPEGAEGLPAAIASRDEVRSLPWVMFDQAEIKPYRDVHDQAVKRMAEGMK